VFYVSWSQWPRGLRCRSLAARLLRLWFRIPPGALMFVCCEYCVFSGRDLCDRLITHPEESYRLWHVIVCDQETSKTRRLKPATRLWKIQPCWVVTPRKQHQQHVFYVNIIAVTLLVMGNSISWLPWLRFSVLFLSCKANARVKLAKSGHGTHLFRIIVFCVMLVIVLCYCLYAVLLLLCCTVIVLLCYYLCCPMYWLCVLYHCHRVLTQLQLTNISM